MLSTSTGVDLRVAILGAFPFPLPQGSQVYVREQARALSLAGAEVALFCYGHGVAAAPSEVPTVRVPRALSPRSFRSGPSFGKPLADAALAAIYVAAQRRQPFDIALAHNIEAAAAALAARPLTRVPVVYVAHTLMGAELSSYRSPSAFGGAALDRLGRGIDGWIARRSEAVIALCLHTARNLTPFASGPIAVIPPGLDPTPPPSELEVALTCARFDLVPQRYGVYAGNLDGYQSLAVLEEAARQLPDFPIVVATHAEPAIRASHLRFLQVSPGEVRALTRGALVALLPRRQPGGFPIKLLNYMDAARPIVARCGIAEGLEQDRSARLLPPDAGAREFASALAELAARPDLCARLGAGAREHLEEHHRWSDIAAKTLSFAEGVISARREGR